MYEFLKEITSSGRMRLPGLPMCWCHSWHFWVTQKWQGQRLGADLLGSCAWYSRAKTQQMWPFENVLRCRYRGFKWWYCLYPTTHAWASKQEIQRMTKYKKRDGRMEDKLWKDQCKEVWICSQTICYSKRGGRTPGLCILSCSCLFLSLCWHESFPPWEVQALS